MKYCDDCEWSRIRIETLEVALKTLTVEVQGLHRLIQNSMLANKSEGDENK